VPKLVLRGRPTAPGTGLLSADSYY